LFVLVATTQMQLTRMYKNYKIIQSNTTLNLLNVVVSFLATCFGSYTETSSDYSLEWSACTIKKSNWSKYVSNNNNNNNNNSPETM